MFCTAQMGRDPVQMCPSGSLLCRENLHLIAHITLAMTFMHREYIKERFPVKMHPSVSSRLSCAHTHAHTQSCYPTNRTTICAVQPASLCVLCLGKLHRVLSKYAGQALSGPTSDNTLHTDCITCMPSCWCLCAVCICTACVCVCLCLCLCVCTRERIKNKERMRNRLSV